jgi:Uma2 family endonuclease
MKNEVTTFESENIVQEPDFSYPGEYTYADYLQFKMDDMVEVIRGKLFRMSPSPRTDHQKIVISISSVIYQFLKNRNCKVFSAPVDVILPVQNKRRNTATTVVQPDICVVCNPDYIEDAGIFGPPDWIVEILSPHTRKKDLQLKYEVYQEAGVKEYWIVMPFEKLVEVFVLDADGLYRRIQTYTEEDSLSPYTLPDLIIDLQEVFEDVK